jgi:septum formation protein
MSQRIILASASARRKQLLDQLNLKAHVMAVDLDETPSEKENPLDYVLRMAYAKAERCRLLSNDFLPVIAADTAVVIDDIILGKPNDKDHAVSMLRQLSGRVHKVFTAVYLFGEQLNYAVNITEVKFKTLNEAEIFAYWNTGEPKDKAGAYAVQGLASVFIEWINGSYSGVMGLPIYETVQLLAKEGIHILSDE